MNGIRAALKKGLREWIMENDFDVICFQETKAQPDQVPAVIFEEMGFHAHWKSAEKKGYSGVLTLSKAEPDKVVYDSGMKKYDFEGRILRTDFGDWTLLNCYFPSGSSGELRQEFKMKYLADFQKWINKLKKEREQLIVVGDYNIAHTEIDIHNPKSNKNSTGFKPEEREWLTKWLKKGFVDSFRHLNPEMVEYSWWNLRSGARKTNKGWRIDYQTVTENLKDKLIYARHLNDIVHSDHCPLLMEIDL